MDQGFAYSDHADFYELIDFVKRCDPSIVYTHHGAEETLASEIKKRLGITAIPLRREKKGQTNLGRYC
jgi:Cft2 family RNA processing exonuclease